MPAALAAPHETTSAVAADSETHPVAHSGDAADDQVIWVNPTNPERFAVIGTDREGALEVYDETGARIQRIADGRPNNVDLRNGFSLAGKTVDLVGIADAEEPAKGSLRFYTIDPATRQLTDVTAGNNLEIGITPFGFCMYRSSVSGKFYAFAQDPGSGQVEQVELVDQAGKVSGKTVRSFGVGSKTEGCVADDGLRHFYISAQDVGIWKYGAEPGDSTKARTMVDKTGRGGHLTADIEGLAIVYQPGDTGYLIASSQGENSFVVYRREGANEFVRELIVISGSEADGWSHTDGIDAVAANLGPAFPQGMFSCQDDVNTAPGRSGNQSFKYVRLEKIVRLGSEAAPPRSRT